MLTHTLLQNALALGTRLGVQRPAAARTEAPDVEICSSEAVQIPQKSDSHNLGVNRAGWIRMILSVAGPCATLPAFCANLIGGRNKHFTTLHNGARVSADLLCIDVRGWFDRLHQPGEERGHCGRRGGGLGGGVKLRLHFLGGGVSPTENGSAAC